VMLSFADKSLFFSLNFLIISCIGTTYKSSAHLEWSPKDVIEVTIVTVYKYTDSLLVRMNCELLTPFESWRRTSISGGYEIC
jgi:hypothetical protein